jgi:phosphoribosylaminoimidazole-succinocarboxamide synthase
MGKYFFNKFASNSFWKEIISKIPLPLTQTSIFKHFLEAGVENHFIDQVDENLKSSENSNILKVMPIEVYQPKKLINNQWDYTVYQKHLSDCLLPLEVIFRFGIPQGSSLLKRASDKDYLKTIGAPENISQGDFFELPLIEFSTKLEPLDRYLSYTEAKKIAGLSNKEFDNLIAQTQIMAFGLKSLIETDSKTLLWDGKLEFALTGKSEIRNFKLVDSIGLDELRVTIDSIHLSKEFLRQCYSKTDWYSQIDEYKKNYSNSWKLRMKEDDLFPKNLDEQTYKLAIDLYSTFEEDLKYNKNNILDWAKKVKKIL